MPTSKPGIVWFTGLSGAGKTTIARRLIERLHAASLDAHLIDGDELRGGLSSDLGFSDHDRLENMRRGAEVARLIANSGSVAVVALISPLQEGRDLARRIAGGVEFVEVFVAIPLALAERRDPKGLYGRARRGEIAAFTGLTSRWEPPRTPELTVETATSTPDEAAEVVFVELCRRGIVPIASGRVGRARLGPDHAVQTSIGTARR